MDIIQTACNVIILIGGICGAITAIMALAGKPINLLKKVREKREKQLRDEIVEDVAKKLTPRFDEIYQQNLEQSEAINLLEKSSRDMLRENILSIYHANKHSRCLTETTREYLQDLYDDYKAENGNHYIDKIYNRMKEWKTIPDEE
jgi:hypothetical protein